MKFIAFLSLLAAAMGASAQALPDWKITAEPQKKLLANHPASMKVSVNDGKGKPVTEATVELAVTMIDMDHGEHKSPTKVIAPGVYEGNINFFMVGAWNLEVRVTRGNQSRTQKIRFDLKE